MSRRSFLFSNERLVGTPTVASGLLNKFLYVIMVTVVALFTISALFGANITMARGHDGAMANCPLMRNQSSLCQMDVASHLTQWLLLFSAVPVMTVLLLLLVLSVFVVAWLAFSDPPPRASPYRYFVSRDPQWRIFNYLVPIFASGILHPKVDA